MFNGSYVFFPKLYLSSIYLLFFNFNFLKFYFTCLDFICGLFEINPLKYFYQIINFENPKTCNLTLWATKIKDKKRPSCITILFYE